MTTLGQGSLVTGMFSIGFGMGIADVSTNAQAVIVEAQTGKPQMGLFHAAYAIGKGFLQCTQATGLYASVTEATSYLLRIFRRCAYSRVICRSWHIAIYKYFHRQCRFHVALFVLPSHAIHVRRGKRSTQALGEYFAKTCYLRL